MSLATRIKHKFSSYPELRHLFFFDPDGEHKEEISAADLEGIDLIELKDGNRFTQKVRLHRESGRYFIYAMEQEPKEDRDILNFQLYDLMVAGRVLRLEDVHEFMEEHGIPGEHKPVLKPLLKALNLKKVQAFIPSGLLGPAFDAHKIRSGIAASYLGGRKPEQEALLVFRLLLLAGKESEVKRQRFIERMREYSTEQHVLQWLYKYFDIDSAELNEEVLREAVFYYKYNRIMGSSGATNADDPYKKYRIEDEQRLYLLESMAMEVRRAGLQEAEEELFSDTGRSIKEENILQTYGYEAAYAFFTSSMAEAFLHLALEQLQKQLPEKAAAILSRIAPEHYKGNQQQAYYFLQHATRLLERIDSVNSWRFSEPEAFVEHYTKEWHHIDFEYRKAMLYATKIIDRSAYETLWQQVDMEYNKFIEAVNTEWMQVLEMQDFGLGKLPVPQQHAFYKEEIGSNELKTAVVISDALRYEAGAELADKLLQDARMQVKPGYRLASLPSVTRIGMAQLLPHKKITFKENICRIEDLSTEGIDNRRLIIQKAQPEGDVISYPAFRELSQNDRRNFFKSPLVYVYHNIIDNTGDTRSSEHRTLEDVERAITELHDLVLNLHSSLNVSRVLVTADHGFLYNERSIQEAGKLPATRGDAHITGKRYELHPDSKREDKYTYNIPHRTCSTLESDYIVSVPRTTARFKKQGFGFRFAHGGASLQELIVPVIQTERKRKDISTKVEIQVLRKTELIIAGKTMKVHLLQINRVDNRRKPLRVLAGLYDGSELLSNEAEVMMDMTSEQASLRKKSLTLSVRPDVSLPAMLELRLYDSEDNINPLLSLPVVNRSVSDIDF